MLLVTNVINNFLNFSAFLFYFVLKVLYSYIPLYFPLFPIAGFLYSPTQVYEDKCSVTYETAYEEVCRTEQEQVCSVVWCSVV